MRIAPVVFAGVIGFACPVVLTQSRMGTAGDEAAILKNRDAQNAAYKIGTMPRRMPCCRPKTSIA